MVKPQIVHLGVMQPELFQLAGIDINMNQVRDSFGRDFIPRLVG